MDISEFSRLHDQHAYLRHPWETSRTKVLERLLSQSGLQFPVDRIVDIGAGDTYVIHYLQQRGYAKEYFAIDTAFTPDVIGQLKENNPDSQVTYVQDLQAYFQEFATEKSTLFLCMDVLEHLPDEGLILDHLQQTGHRYLFAVPAFQSVFSSHDTLLGHYRRYTLDQLEAVLKAKGFSIDNKGYYFSSLLGVRLLEKWLGRDKKESIDNWTGGKFKTGLINFVLKTDFEVTNFINKTGVRIPGLSCYCVCRK